MTTDSLQKGKVLDEEIQKLTGHLANIKASEYAEIRFVAPNTTTAMKLDTEYEMFKAVIVAGVEKKLKAKQEEFDAL